METAHKDLIKKLRCPVCKELISTIANMRVHLKRESQKDGKKYKLRDGKVNGVAIKDVWVPAKSLQHGRYYGSFTDDGSSSNVESDDAATVATDATVRKSPKKKRGSKNTCAKKTRSDVETIEIDDSSYYSESDNLPLARLIEHAHGDEPMEPLQLGGKIFVCYQLVRASLSTKVNYSKGQIVNFCYYGSYTDDGSSSNAQSDNAATIATDATVGKSPKPNRNFDVDFSDSDDLLLARQMDTSYGDEPMDVLESLQQSEGTIFVFYQLSNCQFLFENS